MYFQSLQYLVLLSYWGVEQLQMFCDRVHRWFSQSQFTSKHHDSELGTVSTTLHLMFLSKVEVDLRPGFASSLQSSLKCLFYCFLQFVIFINNLRYFMNVLRVFFHVSLKVFGWVVGPSAYKNPSSTRAKKAATNFSTPSVLLLDDNWRSTGSPPHQDYPVGMTKNYCHSSSRIYWTVYICKLYPYPHHRIIELRPSQNTGLGRKKIIKSLLVKTQRFCWTTKDLYRANTFVLFDNNLIT